MAISQASFNNGEDEEEYIDMEVSSLSSSSSKFLCYSPQSREFEFQMCSVDINGEITSNSPADELFYKGKLLPLHLPPRLQMVQKLVLQQSSNLSTIESKTEVPFEEANSLISSSPLESCRVSSCELNPDDDDDDECFFQWPTTTTTGNNKSWSKKFKQMKQSSIITQKLKASREYLKSLFRKSGCSDESCAKAAAAGENVSKKNKYVKMEKKKPFGSSMELAAENVVAVAVADIHRRSFSGVIQRHSGTNSSSGSSSSSSFSFSSSGGYCDLRLLKRSNSANENSIEGAIAHCKQSQKLGVCSFSASKISVCGDQERPHLCRI